MSRADELRVAMEEARAYTLSLFDDVDDADLRCQAHPDFSPLGWHLGHIGVTESFWILQQCKQEASLSAAYDQFFSPTDNPKLNRVHLPARAEILAYLATVQARVFAFLDCLDFDTAHPLLCDGGIFYMLLQHEEQHTETILLIKQILAADRCGSLVSSAGPPSQDRRATALRQSVMESIPAGPFLMGSDERALTLDNERPRYEQWVKAYSIDRLPVSNAEYLLFVEAGGYENPSWWCADGWQWRTQNAVTHPLYWRKTTSGWREVWTNGVCTLAGERPVSCVCWYEADAYARFIGKRLPTETEWEKAANMNELEGHGEVWEWTSTWFAPYPGFVAHPYEGYSVPYFDDQHRVLRGGSWATRPHVKRTTFRNWYQPWVREIFAGFRCAADASS